METECGDKVWRQSVRIECGDIVWRQSVQVLCLAPADTADAGADATQCRSVVLMKDWDVIEAYPQE